MISLWRRITNFASVMIFHEDIHQTFIPERLKAMVHINAMDKILAATMVYRIYGIVKTH